MNKKRLRILFETEGSYPFSGGGVSTWSHILCTRLKHEADFEIMALTGGPFVESRYSLPDNIKNIIHVPLWGVDEPSSYYDQKRLFSYQIEKKARTNRETVRNLFLPMFKDFIHCLLDPYGPVNIMSDLFYGFWKYFQYYDYKISMKEPMLWEVFKGIIEDKVIKELPENEQPRVFDVTFGMRWFYHFLMPLAVPVSEKTDVSHATIAGFPALLSIAAKYEYGIPSLVTDHGVYMRERLINVGQTDMPYFSKKLLVDLSTLASRAVYATADQISPVTYANKEWEMRFAAKEEVIKPIYNGVDTDLFEPTPKPANTADRPTVIAVAQVFPLKDIETMIRAAHLAQKEIPDIQFTVYGSLEVDRSYVQKCRDLISELGAEDYFTFGGFHDKPHKIFNEGDISILTSISEGFPYTVIESMSCRRPVVATDVGGVRDALEGCGILCKPRDPQDIANGVVKLLNDDNLRIELGNKAREKVLLNFTIEKSVNAYLETYKNLTELQRDPLRYKVECESVKQLLDKIEGVQV